MASNKEENKARDASERAALIEGRARREGTTELAIKPSESALGLSSEELGMIPLDLAERLMVQGDLALLQPQERLLYYQQLCRSLGLNAIARPFEYVLLKGKLSLYATKEAAAQLRVKRGVSFTKMVVSQHSDLLIVDIEARDNEGRVDMDQGAASIAGLRGEELVNARLKAITKAKRRVTLSLCGLGTLDESEVDSIQGARKVSADQAHTMQVVEGEAVALPPGPPPAAPERPQEPRKEQRRPTSTPTPTEVPEQPVSADPLPPEPKVKLDIQADQDASELEGIWERLIKAGWDRKDLNIQYRGAGGSAQVKFKNESPVVRLAVLVRFRELMQQALPPEELDKARGTLPDPTPVEDMTLEQALD